MKRRIYLITALALINIIIMKYQEVRKEQRAGMQAWTARHNSADSLLRMPVE